MSRQNENYIEREGKGSTIRRAATLGQTPGRAHCFSSLGQLQGAHGLSFIHISLRRELQLRRELAGLTDNKCWARIRIHIYLTQTFFILSFS